MAPQRQVEPSRRVPAARGAFQVLREPVRAAGAPNDAPYFLGTWLLPDTLRF